ncbi:MAG TPA: CAP domain-containing protein [Blastocatellia bacterium]|nr:CAP domain-containing protein [Blastocatellia bacterium]
MRRALTTLITLAVALLPVAAPSWAGQSEGVFVGRGKVARGAARADRDSDRGESERSERSERHVPRYDDEDLKPMIAGRTLREIESLESQCFDEVNRLREGYGLAALEFSGELLEVARYYSRRMAEENFFSHVDPEGHTVRQRVSGAGISWRVLGENLAFTNGYINPVAVSVKGWMESPGHRKNILDGSYRQAAIGAWISKDGTVYFTEIFLRR